MQSNKHHDVGRTMLSLCQMACIVALMPWTMAFGQNDQLSSVTPKPSLRPYGGWNASPPVSVQPNPQKSTFDAPQSINLSAVNSSPVQHASYFQSTEGFPSYPQPVVPPPLGNQPASPSGQFQPQPSSAGLRDRGDQIPSLPVDSGLRPANSDTQYAQQFTTGLPHVTPAPGRYPTSPYLGPRNGATFQTIGYQQSVPVTFASQSAVVTPQATLAQHQTTPYQSTQFQPVQLQPTQYQQPTFSSNPTPGIYPVGYQQCQVLPPPSLPPDGAAGTTYIPPTITPNWAPNLYSANNAGFRPLISLGQENYNVVLGRGILGQPTAYVPDQPIRNFLRYIFP